MDYKAIIESCGGRFISMQLATNTVYFFDESGSRVLSLYIAAVTPENVALTLKSAKEGTRDFEPWMPATK